MFVVENKDDNKNDYYMDDSFNYLPQGFELNPEPSPKEIEKVLSSESTLYQENHLFEVRNSERSTNTSSEDQTESQKITKQVIRRGRKKKGDTSKRIHDKDSKDNKRGKVRTAFCKFMQYIVNSVLEKERIKNKVKKEIKLIHIHAQELDLSVSAGTVKSFLLQNPSAKYINPVGNLKKIEEIEKREQNFRLTIRILNTKLSDFYTYIFYRKNNIYGSHFPEYLLNDFNKYLDRDNEKELPKVAVCLNDIIYRGNKKIHDVLP